MTAGTPILTGQFTDLRLVVEAAFGATPGADGPWTDITGDVRADPITITVGRADEASFAQPARCTFAVNNPSGRYTLGPQSPTQGFNHNIPMRVRAVLNGVSYTRMQGELAGAIPGWDETGHYATAAITVSGALRRLSGNTKPVASPMRHYVPTLSSLAAYWPCEEGSKAVKFASAVGALPMTSSTGLPKPASYGGFAASATAPTLGAEAYTASCHSTGDTSGGGQIWLLMNIPAGAVTDQTRLASVSVGCPALTRLDLLYNTASSGSFSFKGYNGTTQVLSGVVTPPGGGADGQDVLVGLDWFPVGGGIIVEVHVVGLHDPYLGLYTGGDATIVSPIATVNSIVIAPDANCSGVSVGHLYYQTTLLDLGTVTVPAAAVGFAGEAVTDRVTRIAAEQGEIVTVTGTSIQAMGDQPIASYVNVLREAETRDLGVLFDGLGRGLSYIARDSRENQEPTIVLDASAKEIVAFPPVFDDQGVVNSFKVTRANGSDYTYSDATSALSVGAIGEHPGSATINSADDAALPDYAGFKVGLGTVPGYRYPSMQLSMHGAPRILPGWLATTVSSRLDVKKLSNVRIGQDPRDLSVLVEGWTESITKFEWTAAVNCTSYDPWRIGVLASDTGDTGEFLARLDSDGSTVVGDTAAGAITLSVATASGPLWITGSGDDFPMDLDVGGLRVTCTSIAGGSSPQTFTVAPTAMKVYGGWSVAPWANPVLGM